MRFLTLIGLTFFLILQFNSHLVATEKMDLEKVIKNFRMGDESSLPLPQEDQMISSLGFNKLEVASYVVELSQNQEIYSVNEDRFFIPASVSKLLVAIPLMKNYGLDHQFETKIYYRGHIVSGKLIGDLILQGAGDPSLDYLDLLELAKLVKAQGITEISGQILYDETLIPKADNISTFFGLLDVYNPAISAFNFNRSRIPLRLKKNSNHYFVESLEYLSPKFQVKIDNNLPSTDPLYSYNGNKENSLWTLNLNNALANYTLGTDQTLSVEEIPMLTPSQYFSQIFFKNLRNELPQLNWNQHGGSALLSNSDILLGSIKGRKLSEMMEKLLLNSDNSYAEILSSRMAHDLGHTVTSLEDNAKELMNWWQKEYPTLNLSSIIFKRASGLTPKNYLSARHLVDVLEIFHQNPVSSTQFLQSFLPVSGIRGELQEEIELPSLKGKIFAKSGYLSYVRALSGYMETYSGKKLAFAIMINDFDQREILNNPKHPDFAKAVAAADAWSAKSKTLRDGLLLKWATEN